MPRSICHIPVIACALLASPALAQPEYYITIIDAPVSTSTRTLVLTGVNGSGIAVGTGDAAATVNGNTSITTRGLAWSPSSGITLLPISGPHDINASGLVAGVNAVYDLNTGVATSMPGLTGNTRAAVLLGINDAGVAVGYIPTCTCSNSQGRQQIPYVWSAAGGPRTLPVPNATGAARVNNAGIIVGWIGGRAATDGYIFDLNTDQFTLISSLFPPMQNGYTPHGSADDITDNGLVTGTFITPDAMVTQGYLYHVGDASATVLPEPPAGYARGVLPAGVNDSGTVVGTITLQSVGPRAFVYSATRGVRDLNTLVASPDFTLLGAFQVNAAGAIIGYGQGGGGLYKSFYLTPRNTQPPACTADFNGSSSLDVQDVFGFLTAWFAADGRADFNHAGGITTQDIFDFLAAWFDGC